MSKRKFFISAGAVILGVAGYLATSANKKFSGIKTAWFTTGGSHVVTLFHNNNGGSNVTHLTTSVTAGRTAFFQTGTVSHTLFADQGETVKLYGI